MVRGDTSKEEGEEEKEEEKEETNGDHGHPDVGDTRRD